jgi:hypothetical protein
MKYPENLISRLYVSGSWVDIRAYDVVQDLSQEYEDHTETHIAFFKDGNVVRRVVDCPCDITYKGAND